MPAETTKVTRRVTAKKVSTPVEQRFIEALKQNMLPDSQVRVDLWDFLDNIGRMLPSTSETGYAVITPEKDGDKIAEHWESEILAPQLKLLGMKIGICEGSFSGTLDRVVSVSANGEEFQLVY